MRLNEAILLHKARTREKNEIKGKPLHKDVISGTTLGRLLWPNQKDVTSRKQISKLRRNQTKGRLSEDQIDLICHELKVDPNFLYGFPSMHDNDFERLVDKDDQEDV